ncbi:MAG TPA: ATP-dependent DNA ligase [Actinomycetota bacterium]|nr:ATP-dependent DNA ligase [Actinomycetota bacterium]
MTLPVRPPLEPMLAKLEREMPRGPGWRYEPKWDGFRAIVFRDGPDVHIESRGKRVLHRYFPELLGPLADALPDRCVVDGEIVLATPDGLDFDALQLRLHPAESRIRLLSRGTPTSYAAFDLLAEGADDLRGRPLGDRHARLVELLGKQPTDRALRSILTPGTTVTVSPWTEDPDEAERWFEQLESVGLDGIIAKHESLRYEPGKRVMVKVKHERTLDCVVGGYRVHKSGKGVGSLLLGLYDERGVLHHVGAAGAFPAKERLAIQEKLRPLEGGEGFGEGTVLGGPSRWRPSEKEWIPLEPKLVCEVAYDHFQGHRLRHLAQFRRWRRDRDPRSCTFAQAGAVPPG